MSVPPTQPETPGDLTCPWCGSAVDEDALLCPACTAPLRVDEPAIPEDPSALPPLPDGGLAALMPAWLRDGPEVAAAEEPFALDDAPFPTSADHAPSSPEPPPTPTPTRPPVSTEPLLTEADLPAWIISLGTRQDGAAPVVPVEVDAVPSGPAAQPLFLPDAPARRVVPEARPTSPDLSGRERETATVAEVGRVPEAGVVADRRRGSGWVAAVVLLLLLALLLAIAFASGVWTT